MKRTQVNLCNKLSLRACLVYTGNFIELNQSGLNGVVIWCSSHQITTQIGPVGLDGRNLAKQEPKDLNSPAFAYSYQILPVKVSST